MIRIRSTIAKGAAMLSALALFACGGRDTVWDTTTYGAHAYGLAGAAAVLDPVAKRVLWLGVGPDQTLAPASIPVGEDAATAATTPGGEKLLVLSRGVVPRERVDDEGPSLTVIDGAAVRGPTRRYELSDPLSGLAVDPASRYAVIYPDAGDETFVENPNELIVVDLAKDPGADNPVPITLRSFGGQPLGFTFTAPLELPGVTHRLLVTRTSRDVSLLDLDDLAKPEITIGLSGSSDTPSVPSGIAVTDGAKGVSDDARIAVRLEGESSVVIVDLLPLTPEQVGTSPQTFRAAPNVVYVGGVPTDAAFVQTDGGLRLAALVPAKSAMTLVDPVTGSTSEVSLGAPYDHMSLVTDVVGAGSKGSDVALLWSTSSPSIALVALGATVGKPYKSVERIALDLPIASVTDVPEPNRQLKLLTSADGSTYFVLDLAKRTAAPILAHYATSITPAPDGRRAWIFAPGEDALASLDLATLHPKNLVLGRPIEAVFDVARRDGGRALLALHDQGALGATVLDATTPDLATARTYGALLLGGVP